MNQEEMILAYCSGELDGEIRTELEKHIDGCSSCGEEMKSWNSCLDSLEKTFPDLDPPVDLMERILAKAEEGEGS
jgi:anti-sigma factor RsiW